MFAAYVIITLITVLANAGAAAADLARARFVLANSAEVGVPRSWLRPLGVLKGAGAAGLVLFFIGALAAHVRGRVFHNIAFPGAYFALAVASTGLAIAAH